MAKAIDKKTVLDLIIEAERADPETGSFAEWLAEYLVEHLPTLTPPNEWVSVDERLPEPTYCVLVYTTDYSIEVDALDSDGEWMSFEVTHWMPLPAPPDKDNNVPAKTPNEPLTLEQLREMDVEKVWRGEWVGVPSMGVYDTVCSKCGYCPGIRFWSSDFCPNCGAPMTDKAVEMVMERLEALKDET